MIRRVAILVAGGLLLAAPTAAGPERVAFPAEYRKHVLYQTVDRAVNDTIRLFYVSVEAARKLKVGQPLPSGTVITMEVYKAKLDEAGKPAKDGGGRFIRGELVSIQVMEKRAGWGQAYDAELRNGDWDYAQFDPDGKSNHPADQTVCLACHKKMAKQDYVFSRPQLAASK